MKKFWYFPLAALVGLCLTVSVAQAQQKIAYVDSDFILQRLPEYQTIQNQVDRLMQEWETELKKKKEEVDELFREYQARELLYTNEERRRKRDEIVQAEEEVERLRVKYFGPEGELFQQQDQLMRPLQERILGAIEEVATREGFDFVFDKSGDFIFLFAREQYNLSNQVLEELGIDVDSAGRGRN